MSAAPWTTRERLDGAGVAAADEALGTLGFRLVRLASSTAGATGGVVYAGVWRADGGPATAFVVDRTTAQLVGDVAARAAEGLVLRDLAGEQVGGETRWAAVFEPAADGAPAPTVELDLDRSRLERALAAAQSDGRRPRLLAAFGTSGGSRFGLLTGVDDGPAWMLDFDLTRARLRRLLNHRLLHGFRPRFVESYAVGGAVRHAGLWTAGRGTPLLVLTDVAHADLGETLAHWQRRGFALEHLSAYTGAGA